METLKMYKVMTLAFYTTFKSRISWTAYPIIANWSYAGQWPITLHGLKKKHAHISAEIREIPCELKVSCNPKLSSSLKNHIK